MKLRPAAASYAKFADDPRVFTIRSATKTSARQDAKDLRDKRLLIFDADKLDAGGTRSKRAGHSSSDRNAQKEWQIVKPKPQRADNGQVEELVRKLGDARMDTSTPDEEAAKVASRLLRWGHASLPRR